ncbi:hypothetical protein ABH925_006474 [Streptacidiphilus sp. EB129]|jgi:hypothetical protein
MDELFLLGPTGQGQELSGAAQSAREAPQPGPPLPRLRAASLQRRKVRRRCAAADRGAL